MRVDCLMMQHELATGPWLNACCRYWRLQPTSSVVSVVKMAAMLVK